MNKVEEFLLEEAVDDLVLSCDSKGEYVYASDMMQKYADQQCAIQRVSQQRELLLAYHRYLTKELSLDLNELWVDEHLKANNCG
jgi:hypothetical protein